MTLYVIYVTPQLIKFFCCRDSLNLKGTIKIAACLKVKQRSQNSLTSTREIGGGERKDEDSKICEEAS